jgi:hypothetical protein
LAAILEPEVAVSRVFLEFMLVYFQIQWLISMLSHSEFKVGSWKMLPSCLKKSQKRIMNSIKGC